MSMLGRLFRRQKMPRLAVVSVPPRNAFAGPQQPPAGPVQWSIADELQKANVERAGNRPAWNIDPDYVALNGGHAALNYISEMHQGALGVDYNMLRRMGSVPTIKSILGTRVTQLAEFSSSVVEADRGQIGYRVKLADPSARMNPEEKKEALKHQQWIQTCGDPSMQPFCSFESFLRQVGMDSMTLDQGNFQVFKRRNNSVVGFRPVDASTIRKAMPTQKEMDEGIEYQFAYVQIVDNKIVRTFQQDEMAWGIRNPRSDIRVRGYGDPELASLIRISTNILEGEVYNAQNFANGMHAAGILAIKAKMGPAAWQSFMRQFNALIHGVQNSNKTVLMQLDPDANEEIQSIGLSQSNKDMEFKEWMAYLQKIVCAIFQIDPAELGYVYGAEGQTGAMTQQGPETRLRYSKEKGLRPFVRNVERWINNYIMLPHTKGKYVLEFVGLDRDLEEMRLEHDIKLLHFHTRNEIRAMRGQEPMNLVENPIANMIGHPPALAQNLAALRLRAEELEHMVQMVMAQAQGAAQEAEEAAAPVPDEVVKAVGDDTEDKDPLDDDNGADENDEDVDRVADPYAYADKGGEIGLIGDLSDTIGSSVAKRMRALRGR